MPDADVRSDSRIDVMTMKSTLQFIRPRAEELTWQSIPWQTSIPEAIRIARDERKPVLLWTMNGNPLALT